MTRAEPARVLIPGVTHLSNDSPLTLQQKAVFNEKWPVKNNNLLLTQFATQHEGGVKHVHLKSI